MRKTDKKKRVVKHNRTKRPYERYQVDLAEISVEYNMKNTFPYLLSRIDHFSKYAWTIPIRNKESITVRNAIARVFIHGYPELIQSDNGKEFINKTLNAYLEGINEKHLYGSPYHPQSHEQYRLSIRRYKILCQQHMIIQMTKNWIGI